MRSLLTVVALASFSAVAADTQVEAVDTAPEPDSITSLPCRPTIACTAELVPAGYFEVEAGYGGRASGGQVGHSGALLLKYTLTDAVQLQLGTNALFLTGAGVAPRAVDGVIPGVKWHFLDQKDFVPSSSVSVHLSVPTQGLEGAVQKTFDAAMWVYFSKDIGRFHADLNFALNVYDLSSPTPQGLAALAVSTNLAFGFAVMTEVYSTIGQGGAVQSDGGWLNALSYSPVPEVVFDAGADVGFYQQTRTVTVFAGVTFVPHRKGPAALTRAPTVSAPVASR